MDIIGTVDDTAGGRESLFFTRTREMEKKPKEIKLVYGKCVDKAPMCGSKVEVRGA